MTTQKDPMIELAEQIEYEKEHAEEIKKQKEEREKIENKKKAEVFVQWVAKAMFGVESFDHVPGVSKVVGHGPHSMAFEIHRQSVRVSIEDQMYKSGWRYKPTGKQLLVIEVGYGSEGKRRFPEKSKGGFSWDKARIFALETAASFRAADVNRHKAERKRADASAVAEQMNLAKGCATEEKVSWGTGRYVSTKRAYIKATEFGSFVVEMPTLTIEQAERILDLVIEMGLHEYNK